MKANENYRSIARTRSKCWAGGAAHTAVWKMPARHSATLATAAACGIKKKKHETKEQGMEKNVRYHEVINHKTVEAINSVSQDLAN